jgi:hypothetical protein
MILLMSNQIESMYYPPVSVHFELNKANKKTRSFFKQ